jgi:hypothetical protein
METMMPKLKARHRIAATGKFIVDGSYICTQAREAFTTFVAPLSGVYAAAVGGDKSPEADKESNGKSH